MYTNSTYKSASAEIIDTKNVKKLLQRISSEVNQPLDNILIKNFISYLNEALYRHINVRVFINKTKDQIENAIVTAFIHKEYTKQGQVDSKYAPEIAYKKYIESQLESESNYTSAESSNADIKTDLTSFAPIIKELSPEQQAIDIKSVIGKTDKTSLLNLFNPEALITTTKIALDSKFRDITESGTDKLSWNIVNQLTRSDMQGYVIVPSSIEKIKSIRMFPMRFPYKEGISNGNYNRITALIEQFATQCIIVGSKRYHFMFQSELDPSTNFYNTFPLDTRAPEFVFTPPTTILNKLSLSFGYPVEPITLDVDRMDVQLLANGVLTTFTTPAPHKLLTGDIVYFTDYKSLGTTATDVQVDNSINSVDGNAIQYIDDTSFGIAINSSTTTPAVANKPYPCYFGSKRIIIELEISYVQSNVK